MDQATVSISDCAALYNSNLFAMDVRLCIIAGSSSNNFPNCFPCKSEKKEEAIFKVKMFEIKYGGGYRHVNRSVSNSDTMKLSKY